MANSSCKPTLSLSTRQRRASHTRKLCAQAATRTEFTWTQKVMMAAVEKLIRFPPIFNKARDAARKRIADRGASIGVDMDAPFAGTQEGETELTAKLAAARDPAVTLPSYYLKPFHAYEAGNLSWQAAREVELAARAVHATVMDPAAATPKADGDAQMRASFHTTALELLAEAGAGGARAAARSSALVVDLGCAVGLSSEAVADVFPGASVLGIDASPYFIAVGRERLQASTSSAAGCIKLQHGLAEATGVPDGSVDVVSMCLVMHELPAQTSRTVMAEAFRMLKAGGVVMLMEMDPRLPTWQSKIRNPFMFAAFKSTEPWLEEYIALDVEGSLAAAGFEAVASRSCTPLHSAFVGVKAS